jgi:phage gpG-like protein
VKTLDASTLREALSSDAGREVVRAAMPALRVLAVAGVKEHFATGTSPEGTPWKPIEHPRPDGGSGRPLRDKGLLAASISATNTEETLALHASHPAANVHQFGATIRPTRAKALTIPLTKEAKRVGSPGRGRFPRALFVLATKGGRSAFLAERDDSGTLTLHYALKREVKIPARPYLGFSSKTLGKVTSLLADRYARRIADVLGGA